MEAVSPSAKETYISPDELAERLGITRRTIDMMRGAGQITGLRVRGQWRYKFSDVIAELEKSTAEKK